ncbi:helix-turn-helix domain-containing protein [Anoxybacillus sp. D401a]|uniref:Helix-turn-helix domain-containing protein n=1 Tax=Anoxybacillus pushchinoensis TaxID=150248 RepID=A0A1I0U7W1_9BACL|nr:helix-turn-helix domain-containing protein [Anoxybacillus pushchinoensis]SFA60141.1 Helix-turn-helix domain-containing protein [Anoxybacillus pushchinoensis]
MTDDSLDVGKIIFDSKTHKILNHLNNDELSIKELAERLDEPPSNLYYPIKKLLEFDLIKVSREVRKKNIIERYYKCNNKYKNLLSIEGDIIEYHYDDLIKTVMLEINKSFKNLQNDIQYKKLSNYESTVEFSFVEKKIKYDTWKKYNELIRDLIDNIPEEDGGNYYRFVITGYKV